MRDRPSLDPTEASFAPRVPRPASYGYACLLCGLAALVHAVYYRSAGPVDDDFIVYRYARNLVEGQGLVFNPGERVEGFTSPLWVLLCALGLRFGIDPSNLSQFLETLGFAGATVAMGLAWKTTHPEGRWPVPSLLTAASPALAYHSAAGLGTTFLAGLLAVGAWRYCVDHVRGRTSWHAPAILGAACLVRQEVAILAVVYCVFERRSRGGGRALLAFAPFVGWTLFRLGYYHALLPVTYRVKKLPFLADLDYGLRYFGTSTLSTGIGVAAVLAAVGLLRSKRWPSPQKCCAAGVLGYTAYVIYVGGDYMQGARFFVPVLPIAYWIGADVARSLLPGTRMRIVTASVVLVLLQWPQALRGEILKLRSELEERWIRVGKALAINADPTQSVETSAVGAIGYFSGLRVVDLLGMTNDVVWRAPPDLSIGDKGHHRHDDAWAISQRPDLILVGSGLLLEGTDTIPAFPWERGVLASHEIEESYRAMSLEVAESYPLVFLLRDGSRPPDNARPYSRN